MMKYYILLMLSALVPYLGYAQKSDTTDTSWGLSVNSTYNTAINSIGITPSASYYRGKSQFELGVGLYPFALQNQRTVSGEFNYKYFPNGADNKFNLFLIMSCAYVNHHVKSFYPATYQYIFLSGGYGMQISVFKGAYLGTNVNLGTYTNSKRSENPYKDYIGTKDMFEKFGMNLSFQLNVGYRF